MSTVTSTSIPLPRPTRPAAAEPRGFRVFAWVVVLADLTLLIAGTAITPNTWDGMGWEWVAWIALVGFAGLAPVPSRRGPQLAMDLPLLLAAGFLYGPIVSGTIAFLGYFDLREMRREVTLSKAFYNRAQISLSVMAASSTFHLLSGSVGRWPIAAVAALAALISDVAVNYSLITVGSVLLGSASSRKALKGLRIGPLRSFVLSYGCFGFLGLLLAEIQLKLGLWGLASFAVPVFLARQTFARGRELESANKVLELRTRALQELSERVAEERRDERLAVAAEIHDELLPALFQVHLMGQVLRQDLAQGRLLDLDADLPGLLIATDSASRTARNLIRDLRNSSLGPAGLNETIKLLGAELETQFDGRIVLDLTDVGGSAFIQLLAFHVIREATRNAIRHSRAQVIRVELANSSSGIRVSVLDDGIGFVPEEVDTTSHFGLDLIGERVHAAGGILKVESALGLGTCVVAELPRDVHEAGPH